MTMGCFGCKKATCYIQVALFYEIGYYALILEVDTYVNAKSIAVRGVIINVVTDIKHAQLILSLNIEIIPLQATSQLEAHVIAFQIIGVATYCETHIRPEVRQESHTVVGSYAILDDQRYLKVVELAMIIANSITRTESFKKFSTPLSEIQTALQEYWCAIGNPESHDTT